MLETILSIAYLPPVQWFAHLLRGNACVEQHEHYQKRSYRNRCHIIAANGWLPLSIPLVKGKHQKTPIRDVRIAYGNGWQENHWQGIRSAYGKSPFFDFYADELEAHFRQRPEFLFDWNMALTGTLLDLMGLDDGTLLHLTEAYQHQPQALDYRGGISPKHPLSDPLFSPLPYRQVFEERHGFLPNASILDLLFCTGPEAGLIVEQCQRLPGQDDYIVWIYQEMEGEIGAIEMALLKEWEKDPENATIAQLLRMERGMSGNYEPQLRDGGSGE